MTRVAYVVAILFVLVVGTANSGGYRFGASDQAFYIPAVSLSADPGLFPRDRAVFEPQMRLWIGDEILGGLVRATGISLEALFAALYVITMAGLALALIALARALGCDWWTIAVALVLVTLRHRIARTGANSLEGYMHPRMLAFALGLAAFVCVARLRPAAAVAWTIAATVVHTSTAIWFAGAVMVAAAWHWRDRRVVPLAAAAAFAVGLVAIAAAVTSLPRMDAEWLAVLGDRDYLFSADWPLYAWLGNLAYPAVLIAIYRQRHRTGLTQPGEAGLLVGPPLARSGLPDLDSTCRAAHRLLRTASGQPDLLAARYRHRGLRRLVALLPSSCAAEVHARASRWWGCLRCWRLAAESLS